MAAVAIELRPTAAQPTSDHAAMKALLSEITESEVEFEYYFVAARMAISGRSEEMSRSATAATSRIAGCGSSQTRVERRRLCAAVELPDRNAELFGLVSEVRGDAGARKHDDPDRKDGKDLVIAPERCGLGVPGPIGLEGDLRDLASVGPGGGDALGALRAAAMEQNHAGVLGVNLVEPVPDRAMVVEVETARKGDLGAGRQQHLGLGAALGGNEVAAVDHRRCKGAVVHHRPDAR